MCGPVLFDSISIAERPDRSADAGGRSDEPLRRPGAVPRAGVAEPDALADPRPDLRPGAHPSSFEMIPIRIPSIDNL